MLAYMIVETCEVHDPEKFQLYVTSVGRRVLDYGARYLVRGGNPEKLDGDWEPTRLVLIEFPDMKTLKSWWDSPEYAALRGLREQSSRCRIVVMQGADSETLVADPPGIG